MTIQNEIAGKGKDKSGSLEPLDKLIKGLAQIIARQVLEQAKAHQAK